MAGIDLRNKLEDGGIVYGTMLSLSRNPRWARAIGELNFDYVIIDNEHSAYSRGEVADFIAAINTTGTTSIVRIPIPSSHYVTMALDAGAHGVLVPYCETVEEVQEVSRSSKMASAEGGTRRQSDGNGGIPKRGIERVSTGEKSQHGCHDWD